ncbi:hypothetical protein [Candidatus Albibeggiatoa sp. nov. NOAA]|uniref:hypothetical protein n=1 Tax=Candidatus Albibeggiatoa sp. nov. NOAA TaxID=3162724 RepID=UPI003301D747|nr:hypothetical protein [Thiotrichaceae bacterium]
MKPIKVVIEGGADGKTSGDKSGRSNKKLNKLMVDLPELLAELQSSASKSINTKSTLTVELQASLSLYEETGGDATIGIPVLKFGGGVKGIETESSKVVLTLKTEIEPTKK